MVFTCCPSYKGGIKGCPGFGSTCSQSSGRVAWARSHGKSKGASRELKPLERPCLQESLWQVTWLSPNSKWKGPQCYQAKITDRRALLCHSCSQISTVCMCVVSSQHSAYISALMKQQSLLFLLPNLVICKENTFVSCTATRIFLSAPVSNSLLVWNFPHDIGSPLGVHGVWMGWRSHLTFQKKQKQNKTKLSSSSLTEISSPIFWLAHNCIIAIR